MKPTLSMFVASEWLHKHIWTLPNNKHLSQERFDRMIDNSKNYVLLIGEEPISYVRLVTDETMVSLFSDVYTVPDHRRKGHAFNLLVKIMSSKPTINTHMLIRPTSAAARDLYKKCGFMFSDEIDFKNHGVMEFI